MRFPKSCANAIIRDPDLIGVSVTVTRWSLTDMRHATVFVGLGRREGGHHRRALNRHRGFLRGEMGYRLPEITPELSLRRDTSFSEPSAQSNPHSEPASPET